MLSENDLVCKIAEYRCKSNLTESDCIKLAAFITIRDCLYPQDDEYPIYSESSGPNDLPSVKSTVDYNGKNEFFAMANGMELDKIWGIVDELLDTIKVINPRLFAGVMRKLEEG